MELRDNDYQMDFAAGSFQDFEEKVLASGLCEVTLPMRFAHMGTKTVVTYECSGYTSLSEWDPKTATACLEILAKLLRTLSKTEDFLIDAGRVRLLPQSVFIHQRRRDVKVAWIPAPKQAVQERLSSLMQVMQERALPDAKIFLERIRHEIALQNLGLREAADHCERLRREACEYGFE